MKILADAGADFSAQDSEGLTAEALADKAKENEITAFLKVYYTINNGCRVKIIKS